MMKNKLIYYSPYIPFIGLFVHLFWPYYQNAKICTVQCNNNDDKHVVMSGLWQGLCYSWLLTMWTN